MRGPYCTDDHAALKADPELAAREIEHRFDQPLPNCVLKMGNCRRCHSSICLRVALPVVEQEAA